MQIDLNCDLGEGEPPSRTRALMRWITSANVACGGHAGSIKIMESCILWARQFRVRLGAHPGIADRAGFGRIGNVPSKSELECLVVQQVSALETLARKHRVPLHHIKLHGALYHAVDQDEELARAFLRRVRRFWPRTKLYARAGGAVARLAGSHHVVVWPEGFLDRGYNDDGTLVPRGEPGAVLRNLNEVRRRLRTLVELRRIVARSGKTLRWNPRTLCVHADSPGSVATVRLAAVLLRPR